MESWYEEKLRKLGAARADLAWEQGGGEPDEDGNPTIEAWPTAGDRASLEAEIGHTASDDEWHTFHEGYRVRCLELQEQHYNEPQH